MQMTVGDALVSSPDLSFPLPVGSKAAMDYARSPSLVLETAASSPQDVAGSRDLGIGSYCEFPQPEEPLSGISRILYVAGLV